MLTSEIKACLASCSKKNTAEREREIEREKEEYFGLGQSEMCKKRVTNCKEDE